MAEIDPELRDKIIETHTLVKRIDEDQKEHKRVINARFRENNKKFEEHQKEIKDTFKAHRADIDAGKTFRTKVIAYASVAATVAAFLFDPIIEGFKRLFGFA